MPVLEDLAGDGESAEPYVVYGRRFKKPPLILAPAFVALLIVLGVAIWGPSWEGSQEQQAQAREAVDGSPVGLGKASEKGRSSVALSKEEASNGESLLKEEGLQSSKTDTGGTKLASLSFQPDGPVEQVEEDLAAVEELCHRHGAVEVRVATDLADRAAVWRGRKAAAAASRAEPSSRCGPIRPRAIGGARSRRARTSRSS